MNHIENEISDAKWNRDRERFANCLMTEDEIEAAIAYWLEAARTCGDQLRAIEFRDYAEYMASVMQDDKDHALGWEIADAYNAGATYRELGERYNLPDRQVRDFVCRFGSRTKPDEQ